MKRLAAGVLAAGILLAGCSPAAAPPGSAPSAGSTASGDPRDSDAPDTPAPLSPTPPAAGAGVAERLAALVGKPGKTPQIVLLGDSFASGEGAGSYLPVNGVADSLCHRSPDALFAGTTGAAAVVNLACSRATMSSLGSPQQVTGHGPAGVPAQLDQLTRQRPDLVLLYVGGNDLGFSDLLQACLLDSDPCSSNPGLHQATAEKLLQLEASLGELYREVEASASAPVLVLPYPRLFDPGAENCGRLSPEELSFGLEVTDALNSTIEQAVHTAALPGVRYVAGLEDSFAGRGACSADPLVNTARLGALLDAVGSEPASLEVLHPTAEGYRVLTHDVVEWMESHPLRGRG